MRIIAGKRVASPMITIGNMNKGQKSPGKRTSKCDDRGRRKLDFCPEKKRPLQGMKVFLDIPNHAKVAEMMKRIEMLGGKVEDFLSKEISLVVTSQRCFDKMESLKSGQSPSPHSTAPSPLQQQYSNRYSVTQGQSPFSMDSPHNSGESVKKSIPSNVSRGKEVLSRVLLSKKGSGTPDVAGKAKKLGASLLTVEEFMDRYMRKRGSAPEIDIVSLKDKRKQPPMMKSSQHHAISQIQVLKLIEPFFKVEIKSRLYRPIFHEIKKWPKVYYESVGTDCPFNVPKEQNSDKRRTQDAELEHDVLSVAEKSEKSDKEKTKEDKTKDIKAVGDLKKIGYCDCCCVKYHDLKKHIKSEKHRTFARDDGNYKNLDKLIRQCTPFEEFLKVIKRNIPKKEISELETTDMESILNLDDGMLECTINQDSSLLPVGKTRIQECDKVVIQDNNIIAIRPGIKTNKGKNISDMIQKKEADIQQGDVRDIKQNDKSNFKKHDHDMKENNTSNSKQICSINNNGDKRKVDGQQNGDIDIRENIKDDVNLKMNENIRKEESLNNEKQENTIEESRKNIQTIVDDISCKQNVHPPEDESCTISCEPVDIKKSQILNHVKYPIEDDSILDCTTEAYAILGDTIRNPSEQNESIVKSDVKSDVVCPLEQTDEQLEKNDRECVVIPNNHKKDAENNQYSLVEVTGNCCRLNVKTILEASNIEIKSECIQPMMDSSYFRNNKEVESKDEVNIADTYVDTDVDAVNKTIENLIIEIDSSASINDMNKKLEKVTGEVDNMVSISNVNPGDLNGNLDEDLKSISDVLANVKVCDANEVIIQSTKLTTPPNEDTGSVPCESADGYVNNEKCAVKSIVKESKDIVSIELMESTCLGLSNNDSKKQNKTNPRVLSTCNGRSSTPRKDNTVERVNDLEFSLESSTTSSTRVDSYEGDQCEPLSPTVVKNFPFESKFRTMGCKENFSPICRRTKRKKRKNITSESRVLTDVVGAKSTDEEFVKILRSGNLPTDNALNKSIEKDDVKKELFSEECVNVKTKQKLDENLNSAGITLGTEFITKSTPKREKNSKQSESLTPEISLLKHLLEFKSPGRLLGSESRPDTTKGTFKCITDILEKHATENIADSLLYKSGDSKKKKKLLFDEDEEKVGIEIDQSKNINGNEEKCSENTAKNSELCEEVVTDLLLAPSYEENKCIDGDDDDIFCDPIKSLDESNTGEEEGTLLEIALPSSCDSDDSDNFVLSTYRDRKTSFLNVDDVFTPESNKCFREERSDSERSVTEESECKIDEDDDDITEYDPLNLSYRSFIKLYGRRSTKTNDQKRKIISPIEPEKERKRSRSNNENTNSMKVVTSKPSRNNSHSKSSSRKTAASDKNITNGETKSKVLNEVKSPEASVTIPIFRSPRLAACYASSNSPDSTKKKRLYSEQNRHADHESIESSILNSKDLEYDEKNESYTGSHPSSSILFKSPKSSRKNRNLHTAEVSNPYKSFLEIDTSFISKEKSKNRLKCSRGISAGQNVRKFSCGTMYKKNSPYTTSSVSRKRNCSSLSNFDFTDT